MWLATVSKNVPDRSKGSRGGVSDIDTIYLDLLVSFYNWPNGVRNGIMVLIIAAS